MILLFFTTFSQLQNVFAQESFLLECERYGVSENIVGALADQFYNFQIQVTRIFRFRVSNRDFLEFWLDFFGRDIDWRYDVSAAS